MNNIFKKLIRKITPNKLAKFYQQPIKAKHNELLEFGTISYSQEGEDLILKRIFENKQTGFFVDVGAHHPKRFSNTYLFYQRGWRGINIDPMPGIMQKFNHIRPNDINIEAAISDKKENLTYYIFNEPALNTFSETEAKKKDGLNNYKIIEKKIIEVSRLDEFLDKYLPKNQNIDFISIDVEGLDLNVLRSNNWTKYRPKIVLAEAIQSSLENIFDTELVQYMILNNYALFAKTFNTLFFRDQTK